MTITKDSLPYQDVLFIIYSKFSNADNIDESAELYSGEMNSAGTAYLGSPITVIPRESSQDVLDKIRNDTKEYARLSVFCNPPDHYSYGAIEIDGYLQIEFFYNAKLGASVILGWVNKVEKRFTRKVLTGDGVENTLQFYTGNVQYKGRDRFDPTLGYATYRIPFCYYKKIH